MFDTHVGGKFDAKDVPTMLRRRAYYAVCLRAIFLRCFGEYFRNFSKVPCDRDVIAVSKECEDCRRRIANIAY